MDKCKSVQPNEMPFVSIIMPVRNEALFIPRSVGSLLRQSYPHDRMEVIIADGMSSDKTRDEISLMRETGPLMVKVIDNPKLIAAAGLNRAMDEAKGEIVIRVDGHCEVDPDYVRNCVKLLQENRAEGVGGPIETIGETFLAKAIALSMSSPFGVGGSAFRTVNNREIYTDTVAFPGYTKKICEKVGPFNEDLVRNQDDEYNFRIRKSGGRILLSPTIRSRYYSRSTFRSLWRQYYQYGFWKVRVFQLHPRQMSIRQFVPVLFVTSLISLIFLSFFSSIAFGALSVLILTYTLVSLAASMAAARGEFRFVPLLITSYAILHCSYGLGFLSGLIAFWKGWGKNGLDRSPIVDT